MKTFTVMRGWTIKANTRWEARQIFYDLEAKGLDKDHFKFESVKEDEQPAGWLGSIKKQLKG